MRPPETFRVGELARTTGVTVRTLHHYDAIGLLEPSRRSEAGHRLYTAEDVARLQGIRSLQALGLSLSEVRDWLDRPDASPKEVLELHLARLRERLELEQQLCRLLETLAARLRAAEDVSAQSFIHIIEVIGMVEKYYSKKQLAELERRRQALGEERLQQVEAEWPELIAQVRAEMASGSEPSSERVQALARHWQELVGEFTGGNPAIERSLGTTYEQEPELARRSGLDGEVFAYIAKAQAAVEEG